MERRGDCFELFKSLQQAMQASVDDGMAAHWRPPPLQAGDTHGLSFGLHSLFWLILSLWPQCGLAQ